MGFSDATDEDFFFFFFFFKCPPPYRLRGVKITHRKAENQIKMAKMIMMNELNKRANLLIEQLEVITFSPFSSKSYRARLAIPARDERERLHAKTVPEKHVCDDNLSKPLKRTA